MAIRPVAMTRLFSTTFEFKSVGEYDSISIKTLDSLFEEVEGLADRITVPPGYDVEFSVT